MQVPTHGQWWSKDSTQLLHTLQWCVRGGREWWDVAQYVTHTIRPPGVSIYFVRGMRSGVPSLLSTSGAECRGMMPGSLLGSRV